jgi:hypothetical protein
VSTTEETEMQYTLTGYVLFIGNNRGGHYKVTVEDIIIFLYNDENTRDLNDIERDSSLYKC